MMLFFWVHFFGYMDEGFSAGDIFLGGFSKEKGDELVG
jgi:hypothetical protein